MARTSKTPIKPSKKLSSEPTKSATKVTSKVPAKPSKAKAPVTKGSEDFQEVRSLIELMKKNGLAVFKFEQGDFKITLKTPEGAAGGATVIHGSAPTAAPAPVAVVPAAAPASAEPAKPNYKEIKSPMVGTFYASPSPDSPSFVEVGKTINAESVVCIIEAMKVMNEIKAEIAGKIVEIVAQDGKPVQFGEVLFRVS
jgi:acetyl-CoA carboxylase biotin carboxyl carrier protein